MEDFFKLKVIVPINNMDIGTNPKSLVVFFKQGRS